VTALITIVHVLICLILIIAVLLQSGKAADLAGAFGGAGSQTAFGPRSTATILSKVTTICAILFMVTSLSLWVLSGTQGRSAVSGVVAPTDKAAAVEPGTKPETKTDAAPATSQPAAKPDDKAAAAATPPAGDKQPPATAPAKTETKPPSVPVKK
jgi:preprotein translocase subunit SecG